MNIQLRDELSLNKPKTDCPVPPLFSKFRGDGTEFLKNMKIKKQKLIAFLNIYLDSEYSKTHYLTMQFRINIKIPQLNILDCFNHIIIDKEFEEIIYKIAFEFEQENNLIITYKELTTNLLECYMFQIFLEHLLIKYPDLKEHDLEFETNLYFFYSVVDLYIAFGKEVILEKIKNNQITSKRVIAGKLNIVEVFHTKTYIFKVKLKDMFGLSSMSLKDFALSYGINIGNKEILDKYKSNMNEALMQVPRDFLQYGFNDVLILEELLEVVISSFNNILKDVFKELKFVYTHTNIPMTIGSIVNQLYDFYFNNVLLSNDDLNFIALAKISILDSFNPDYQENLNLMEFLKKIKSKQDLLDLQEKNNGLFLKLVKFSRNKYNFSIYAFEYCSYKYFNEYHPLKDYRISALGSVTGGRTVNERPLEYSIPFGIDIDISGAYASVLKQIGQPLNKPIIFTTDINSKKKKLGNFLRSNKKNLNKYFKILVSGKLSFEQNLILSRLDSVNVLKNALNKDFLDKNITQSSRTSVLLRREINFGVITQDVLNILEKVCSNAELKEIYDLEIESALYYPEKEYLPLPEFIDSCLKNENHLNWTILNFEEFILKLINLRKKYKNDPSTFSLNVALKLVLNTFYGILASIYFKVNNSLLGDLITTQIRMSSWLLTTAFGGSQTITDGCSFNLTTVPIQKTNLKLLKKPSLSILSNYYTLAQHRSIKTRNLNNIDWQEYFKNISQIYNLKEVTDYCTNHLLIFWSIYNIQINFEIEIKYLFIKGAYIGKSFYYYLSYNSKINNFQVYYKIRSFKFSNEIEFQYPIYYLLKYISENQDQIGYDYKPYLISNNSIYYKTKILKIASYKENLKKDKNYLLIPGDSYLEKSTFKLGNDYFFIYTKKDYQKIKRRKENRIDNRYQFLFEKYFSKGIYFTILKMKEDEL